METLTVIVPFHNEEKFLEQSVNRLLNNNIFQKILLIDNNSTDGSSEMIKKEFPYCKLIQNKVNVGFSKANNQAIKKSKGKYILL